MNDECFVISVERIHVRWNDEGKCREYYKKYGRRYLCFWNGCDYFWCKKGELEGMVSRIAEDSREMKFKVFSNVPDSLEVFVRKMFDKKTEH